MTWMTRQRARVARVRRSFPRLRDAAAVSVGLIAAASTLLTRFGDGRPEAVVEGALCTVAALSLWWRRRHPVAVTWLNSVVTLVTGVQYGVVISIGTLAVRRRDRAFLLLSVVTSVVSVAGPRWTWLHDPTNEGNFASEVISSTLLLGCVIAIGAFVGARRDLLASLHERAERAEAEREIREEQGRLAERTRIAREMHDVLAHKVSLIALQAGGLEVTNNPTTEQVRSSAALIRQTAHQAMDDLRDVLSMLRDIDADGRTRFAPQPGLADIAGLVDASRRAGLPIVVTGAADLSQPTPDLVGRAAFRFVQEALTNIHKHARSASTTLRMDGSPGGDLELEVVNLGPVAADQLLPGSGVGLVGLRERIELAGGEFTAGPTADGGFRVHAVLPWPVEPPRSSTSTAVTEATGPAATSAGTAASTLTGGVTR